jgi:hypothetical protein
VVARRLRGSPDGALGLHDAHNQGSFGHHLVDGGLPLRCRDVPRLRVDEQATSGSAGHHDPADRHRGDSRLVVFQLVELASSKTVGSHNSEPTPASRRLLQKLARLFYCKKVGCPFI